MLKKVLFISLAFMLTSFSYAKDLQFSGYTSYKRSGGSIRLQADTVRNNRNGGISGTLKLMLWACNRKYRGGRINGYVIGESVLGQLNGNNYFPNVSNWVSFIAPPLGSYYMTLTLSEYSHGRYEIVDYVNYRRRERF